MRCYVAKTKGKVQARLRFSDGRSQDIHIYVKNLQAGGPRVNDPSKANPKPPPYWPRRARQSARGARSRHFYVSISEQSFSYLKSNLSGRVHANSGKSRLNQRVATRRSGSRDIFRRIWPDSPRGGRGLPSTVIFKPPAFPVSIINPFSSGTRYVSPAFRT